MENDNEIEQVKQYLFNSCNSEIVTLISNWINHLKEIKTVPKYGYNVQITITSGSINPLSPPKAVNHVLTHSQKEEI